MMSLRLCLATALLFSAGNIARTADDPLPEGAKLRLGTGRMRTGFANVPACLTPDGKLLAVSAGNNKVGFIDPATGETRRTVEIRGEFGNVTAFSADGQRALSVGYGVAFVWNTESGQFIMTLKHPIPAGENIAALSADGKRLVLGGLKAEKDPGITIIVWDVDENKKLASVKPVQNQSVSVAISPDGKKIATWGYYYDPSAKRPPDEKTDPNRVIQFWDASTGKELGKSQLSSNFNVATVVFSPDGSLAAASGGDGPVQLFDTATGKPAGTLLARAREGRRMAFSPDGKTLAAAGEDGVVQRWTLPEGKRAGITEPPVPLNYSPRGIHLISNEEAVVWGLRGSAILVWNIPSGKSISPVGGNYEAVTGIAVAQGGDEWLTAARDGRILRWDMASGKEKGVLELHQPNTAYGMRIVNAPLMLSPDGKYALTSEGGNQGVYEVATGRQQFVIPVDLNQQAQGTFTPDGQKVIQVRTSFDPKKYPPWVTVWDIATSKNAGSVELPETTNVFASVTSDGKILMTLAVKANPMGPGDMVVTGWELPSGKKLGEHTEGGGYGNIYITAMGDDKSAIVCTAKGPVVIIDVTTGKVVRELDTKGRRPGLAPVLSPDKKTVAIAEMAGFGPGATAPIQLIDLATGKSRKTLDGAAGNTTALYFSPDGKKLLSASSDTTVLVWDIAGE
jgi:WD40 repeat protein